MRNTEYQHHEHDCRTDYPLVVLPLQRGQGSQEEEERQQRLIISQISSIGESRPPGTESGMLDERSEDETSHEHDAHGKFQPLSVVLARNDQQEGIDGQQHGSEHEQDVGNQDACGHVVAETSTHHSSN